MKGVFKFISLALIFVTTTSIKLNKQDIAISKHGAKDIIVIDKENIPEQKINSKFLLLFFIYH